MKTPYFVSLLLSLVLAAGVSGCGPTYPVPRTAGSLTAQPLAGFASTRALVTVKCSSCSKGSIGNIEDVVAGELERLGFGTAAAHALIGVPSNKQEFSLGGSGISNSSFLGGLLGGSAGKEAMTFYDLPPDQQNRLIADARTDARADVSIIESRYNEGVVPIEVLLRLGNGSQGEQQAGAAACTSYWTPGKDKTTITRTAEEAIREATRCALDHLLRQGAPPVAVAPVAVAPPAPPAPAPAPVAPAPVAPAPVAPVPAAPVPAAPVPAAPLADSPPPVAPAPAAPEAAPQPAESMPAQPVAAPPLPPVQPTGQQSIGEVAQPAAQSKFALGAGIGAHLPQGDFDSDVINPSVGVRITGTYKVTPVFGVFLGLRYISVSFSDLVPSDVSASQRDLGVGVSVATEVAKGTDLVGEFELMNSSLSQDGESDSANGIGLRGGFLFALNDKTNIGAIAGYTTASKNGVSAAWLSFEAALSYWF